MLTRSRVAKVVARAYATAVSHNVTKQQFMIPCGNDEAVIKYVKEKNAIVFHHTEVPAVCQGQGLAKKLAEHAFSYAFKQRIPVIVRCTYLAKYYNENKEKYQGLHVTLDLN